MKNLNLIINTVPMNRFKTIGSTMVYDEICQKVEIQRVNTTILFSAYQKAFTI